MSKLFDRYAPYRREVGERFGTNMVDWWQSLFERACWPQAHTSQTIHLGHQPYLEWKIQRSLPPRVEIIAPIKQEARVPEIKAMPIGEIQAGRGILRTLREAVQWAKAVFVLGMLLLFGYLIMNLLIKAAGK